MSGIFGAGQLQFLGGEDAFYGFEITNSLRFNDDDSAFLSRTPSSAGNRKTFTFSCWLKRANTDNGSTHFFSAGHTDFNNFAGMQFIGDEIAFQNYNSGTQVIARSGTALFRDSASWYNIVIAMDSTQSTQADRLKLYVNGTQITSFDGSDADLTLNFEGQFNDTRQHTIGCRQAASQSAFFDGYLAEVNFIDGSALTPSSFGETKENIWIPKDTSGLTFGTNGFRLQFKNSSVGSASSSTVGADTSGNNNHFSSNNITTTDNMTDSPTDNHATMNPAANTFFNGTFSDGNLQIVPGSFTFATSTIGMTSGKYYAEVEFEANSAAQMLCGISRVKPVANGDNLGSKDGQIGYYNINGNKLVNGATAASYAIDTTKTYFFASGDFSSANNNTMIWNYGANAFTYTPPSGFGKLSTANLPNPAIDPAQGENPTEYWDAQLHTGNGGTQAISSFAFQPNWVWIKNRDNADDHYMYDSIRGATKTLHSNKTDAEFTSPNALQSFDSDGFTTGGDGGTNRSSQGYVAWAWKAETSQSFSGESGTSDSTVSSSSEAGFSIVKYTGGSTERVKHGLGAAPEWILVKDLDSASNWAVYHSGLTTNNFLELNGTGAQSSGSNPRFLSSTYGTSVPTSTYFFVRNYSGSTTNNTGNEYIAYCFAPKEGYSKFGTYEGTNAAGGPFVYLGFRPALVILKLADSSSNGFFMFDNKRNTHNEVDNYLLANDSGAEINQAARAVDFLSNGFKLRTDAEFDPNGSGTYVYMAFADQPFKFSNAR